MALKPSSVTLRVCAMLLLSCALFTSTKGVFAVQNLRTGLLAADDDGGSTEDRAPHILTKLASTFKGGNKKNPAAELISRKPTEADKLFKKFNLANVWHDLEHKQYVKWEREVTRKYWKRVDSSGVEMLSTLTARYGDEAAANVIAAARAKNKHNVIAAKLETAEHFDWFTKEKSASDVFNLLQLDEAQGPILEKPALRSWIKYAEFIGENPYEILFSKLSTRYGDDGVTQILVSAKGVGDTKALATKMDDMLLQSWRQGKYSADDAFTFLKLDRQEFDTPAFSTWMLYLAKLDDRNPDELMFATLKARYGDEGVQQMMNKAEETIKTIDARLGDIRKKERASDDELSEFYQLMAKRKATKDVVTRLTEEIWRTEGKTGDDIFKMLQLEYDRENPYNLFINPKLDTWTSYMTKLHNVDKKNPDAISILEGWFGRFGLADVLSTPKTPAAEHVRTLQFKKWLSEGIHPDVISVRTMGMYNHIKIQVGYRLFYNANARPRAR